MNRIRLHISPRFSLRSLHALLPVLALIIAMPSYGGNAGVRVANTFVNRAGEDLRLSADIILDGMKLKRNSQVYITPVLEDNAGNSVVLPALLVNGHAMQIAYERHAVNGDAGNREVFKAVKRKNGKSQTVSYLATTPLRKWMWSDNASVRWTVDTCGCGHLYGSLAGEPERLGLNPAPKMRVAFITPAVTELPVTVHEGKAQVKFELSKSELHSEPYACRNGQKIDNRAELKIIDDSISYALSDKNVEIARIRICGYASPEGPYLNNQQLSTDRSRALSEYIAARYKLPAEKSEYDAVAENWKGFREIVMKSRDLNTAQRNDLLALIDRPAYGPSDYDAKEKELRTDPRFADLFNSVILPEWFPQLRATRFEISTRLKPLSDEELAKVMKHSPEKMSLNQMFRVARLYPEGSGEFNEAIATALRYYPDDGTANLNAAAASLKSGDTDKARRLLEKAGDTPEAENARGIIACMNGDMEEAEARFKAAGALPEAAKNLEMIK